MTRRHVHRDDLNRLRDELSGAHAVPRPASDAERAERLMEQLIKSLQRERRQ